MDTILFNGRIAALDRAKPAAIRQGHWIAETRLSESVSLRAAAAMRAFAVTTILEADRPCPPATDGEIAAMNLESSRLRAWTRFGEDARLTGIAEAVVDRERLAAQLLGDLDALDRLEALASRFAYVDDSSRAALVDAEVASMVHRFDDARRHLERAGVKGAPAEAIERHVLAIDQACGANLDAVLAARHRIASESGRLEDLVPLGAVLADVERFTEADAVYRRAFYSYDGISPFPLAWVCFQLGVLWGELVTVPDADLAALWYRRAIDYLPGYVKARVHLAEIYASQDRAGDAEAVLLSSLASRDPEIRWRFAEVLRAQHRFEEAETHLQFARIGYDELLGRHLLAFADHAAEFYAGIGNDRCRAYGLARANVANRATRRAIKQANAIAANVDADTVRGNSGESGPCRHDRHGPR